MTALKYTVIKHDKQYKKYCDLLEELLDSDSPDEDEIELLTALIEKWENENNSFSDLDPVEVIRELKCEHGLKDKDLAEILDLSKGTVSKILHYKKGLSKASIRKLSDHFKMSQEVFNQHCHLQKDEYQEV
ncbi:MAG: type II toxin-antitoxin system HigA family antitoxin [Flavobacteriales bacterium]